MTQNGWIYKDALGKTHYEANKYETSRNVAQRNHRIFCEALAKALLAKWARGVDTVGIMYVKKGDRDSNRHDDRWMPTSGPDGTLESLNAFRTQSILGLHTQAAVEKLAEVFEKHGMNAYYMDFHDITPQEIQAFMPQQE